MTIELRIVLIAVSLFTTLFMMKRIRQSRVQIEDSIFWVIFSLMLILFSLFPGIPDFMSGLVGTYSTANFIFMFMIFILLVKNFSFTIRISQLETKVKELVQKEAIDELEKREKERQRKTAERDGKDEKP